jgi:CRP-like cAMP-binding protein
MSRSVLDAALPTTAIRTANVIAEDVELAEAIGADRRDAGVRAGRALLLSVGLGEWDGGEDDATGGDGFGLLVLSGLLVRRVGIGERLAAELLGPGDLLRPREHDGEAATIPFEATWRVLDPLRLAVLDRRWSFRMAPFPEVAIELAARAVRRSCRLATTMAISHYPRLDDRLLLLLWELADRCGTVGRDGVHVPISLTHELLSHLVGARRPSVSGALGRLAAAGLVQRDGRGWLLLGEPPTPDMCSRGSEAGPAWTSPAGHELSTSGRPPRTADPGRAA